MYIYIYVFFINNDAAFLLLAQSVSDMLFKVYEYYDCHCEIICFNCCGSYQKIESI